MKEILSLQKKFKNHLYQQKDQEILTLLPYSKKEALARLGIYRNNVFGGFNYVLSEIYEVVQKLVGEKYFQQLCDSYHQKYFSKTGDLDDYGDYFPQFLKAEKSKHKLPYLPDIAALELLHHQCYFCEVGEVFDLENFKKLPQEKLFDLQFSLSPACFLFESKFPVFSIWQSNIENKKSKKISLNKGEFVLIEKVLGDVTLHNLSKEEFLFLKNISKKTLFETYKEIIRNCKKECDIGKILNKFIAIGVIKKFKVKSTKSKRRKNV